MDKSIRENMEKGDNDHRHTHTRKIQILYKYKVINYDNELFDSVARSAFHLCIQ